MKKIILVFSFFVSFYSLRAQVLYSTASSGGLYGGGTITKLETATNKLSSVFNFGESDGAYPIYSNTIQASNGLLYGMTEQGGMYGKGVMFSFDPANGLYNRLFNFYDFKDSTTGISPKGSLIQASNGLLYGMTAGGGSNHAGVIFSFNPVSRTYTILKDFNGNDGGHPSGSLVQASNGKLYGLTEGGGNNNKGVIFSFNPVNNLYIKLIDFNGSNGAKPFGSLIQATNGKLYGMTSEGGSVNGGIIFSFDPEINDYSKLKDFDFHNRGGFNPFGSLMQARDGKLYGMTSKGGINEAGVAFSFDIAQFVYTKVLDFSYYKESGIFPKGNLVQAANNKLYGMTSEGGNYNKGIIFSFDPINHLFTKLKDFDSTNGSFPKGSLMLANNGKLYGMTTHGSSGNKGVILSYDIQTNNYTKVKMFDVSSTGLNVQGGLTKASDGKLYGMTTNGGNGNSGVLFSFNPATNMFAKITNFDTSTGRDPFGSLIQATDGKLYGMTQYGGKHFEGTLFSFDPATNTFLKLKDFDGIHGGQPTGSLMQARDGKLYGMTTLGGIHKSGVIFSYNPSTSVYTKLVDFNGTNGASPSGNLIQAQNGKLYGLTVGGGSNGQGNIFSFDPVTNTLSNLIDFFFDPNFYPSGASPYGSLVQAVDGKLYGTTANGGSSDKGTLFSIDLTNNAYNTVTDFDGSNGANPHSTLVQGGNGKLYGVTREGGKNNLGVAFTYDPAKAVYTKLADYDATSGSYPMYTYFTDAACNNPTTFYRDADGDGFGDAKSTTLSCVSTPPTGYVANSTDCNDTDNTIYPGAPELCDGKDNNCNGTIDEGCTITSIHIGESAHYEGNSGQTKMKFQVTLSQPATRTITVEYHTQNGSAVAPTDYVAQNGTLTFQPGDKSHDINILVNGDVLAEPDENFSVVLSNASGNAVISRHTGVGVILNDDHNANFAKTTDDNRTALGITPTMNVSPNPASSKMQVHISGFSGNVLLQLMDLQGRRISEITMHSGYTESLLHQFDVVAYPSGTYLLSATDESGNKQTQKIVIRH